MTIPYKKISWSVLLIAVAYIVVWASSVQAAPGDAPIPNIGINVKPAENMQETSNSLQILLILTILSLAPSILIMMTAFTRIIIVLSFVRNAIGVQQMPPNQIMIGLALFITFFVMSPIFNEINEKAYQPYVTNKISQTTALETAMKPLREFMLKQTYPKDLNLFISLSKKQAPAKIEDIANEVLIPAFITSEIKRSFQIGFFIFIPFIVIDMIVSSVLMSMGMMMLPPMMISLPFKILLFVMVDGWNLVIKMLISSFK